MRDGRPRVSIGMPLFNGEPFLIEALDSILAQTYEDFELIISDNASTDRTAEICQDYATKDPRIRYFRNSTNLGAAKNFNIAFHLSSAQYFKWAAHDDICAPDYLLRCVQILDNSPSVVLTYPKTKCIDEDGKFVHIYDFRLNIDSSNPVERFHDLIVADHWCIAVFGLMRSHILKRTSLIGSYSGSDRILLGEVALYGRFIEIPEFLFLQRKRGPERVFPGHRSREGWHDTSREGRMVFPSWCNMRGILSASLRAPLPWDQRLSCFRTLAKWMLQNRHRLADDIEAVFPPFTICYVTIKYSLKALITLRRRFFETMTFVRQLVKRAQSSILHTTIRRRDE